MMEIALFCGLTKSFSSEKIMNITLRTVHKSAAQGEGNSKNFGEKSFRRSCEETFSSRIATTLL